MYFNVYLIKFNTHKYGWGTFDSKRVRWRLKTFIILFLYCVSQLKCIQFGHLVTTWATWTSSKVSQVIIKDFKIIGLGTWRSWQSACHELEDLGLIPSNYIKSQVCPQISIISTQQRYGQEITGSCWLATLYESASFRSMRDHISKDKVWAGEMAQWVKVLAATSDDMRSDNQV